MSRWSQEQCKEGLGHLNITPHPGPPKPNRRQKLQDLRGTVDRVTPQGVPTSSPALGFSLGLNMKNAVFTLTREKVSLCLRFHILQG